MVGRTFSPEHRASLSIAMTGLTRSKEHCDAISAGRTGIQYSQAGKASLSQGHLILITASGSVYTKFLGSWKSALRLAWTFYHGVIKPGEIICPQNGDRLDMSEGNLNTMTKGDHFLFHKASRRLN